MNDYRNNYEYQCITYSVGDDGIQGVPIFLRVAGEYISVLNLYV